MYVLLNGLFDYEVERPEVQVLVVGASQDEVYEVVERAAEAVGDEDVLGREELVEAVRRAGYQVVEVPVVEFTAWNGVERR